MRVSPSTQVQQAYAAPKPKDAQSLTYQARVLKRALDAHKDKESELLKLLEPKGQVIDIKA